MPKKGKNLTELSGCRPISLLSFFSKITEITIKNRLLKILENENFFVNEQFGFRTGHSTVDTLVRLTNEITKNFNDNKHTGALLLDIADAFPTVWLNGLIFKLIQLKIPIYLILVLISYLKGRKMFVDINGICSEIFELFAGVPQGSVLGPILFIIFINDAPMIKDTHASLFADDKLIFAISKLISAIINRLQAALNKNKRYFHKWKIKLNDNKLEAIIFTKRRPLIDKYLKIENLEIKWSKNVKYLGIILDNRLNYQAHLSNVTQKAITKLIKLYPILNKNSHFSTQSKLLLYKSNIRPTISYAYPIWSYISKSSFDKLQVLQNKFLRLIGNYRAYTPIVQMHKELNIEYMYEFIKRLNERYYNRLDSHKNILMSNIKYENVNFKHKRIMNILYN